MQATDHCAECARLSNDSVTLLWEYNTARDALAMTVVVDPAYADRWAHVARVSEQLSEAYQLAHLHQASHPPDLIVRRQLDRRVSLVRDRRRLARGGRRHSDYGWASPPPLVACAACPTGTASLLERTVTGSRSAVSYRCRDCGHQFDRPAGA
jgi:hypothetical protein